MNKYCKEFLENIAEAKNYWLNLSQKTVDESRKFTNESDLEYRMNGLIFSIMVLIDGCSSSNWFKKYQIKYANTILNKDIELHDLVGDFLRNDKEY